MTVTLLLGGTFDPVHIGHVASARAIMELFDDCRMVLIPSKLPPHRDLPSATPEQRLEMLRLATADESSIECDDCELNRDGHSYTVDTLAEYRRRVGHEPLVFAMGLDAWVTLPTWHNWQDLSDLAHIIIMMRPGGDRVDEPEALKTWAEPKLVDEPQELLREDAGLICHVTLPQIDVSATAVRKAIRVGASTSEMLHPGVTDYIAREGLYLDNKSNG